jgi:CDP-glucose 4,6-dehydratase
LEKVVKHKRAQIDPAFWHGRRVLVTGHTGFKGSWLTIWLKQLGCQVTGLSLKPSTDPALFELANIFELCESHIVDIRDALKLNAVVRQTQPEVVFHLAAQALVRQGYRDPIETFSTNTMGTANILESLRLTDSAKAVVMVTTDKVYRNIESLRPYKEDDALGGFDPYSASKAASELIIDCYRNSFLNVKGISVASARAGNVIGGGDWAADRLIPDAIRAWTCKKIIEVRNPASIRPWQHVLEPLKGYIILAQHLASSSGLAGAFNFGPEFNEATTVRRVIELAQNSWSGAQVQWGESSAQVHEAAYLRLETSKALDVLGVQSVWTTERAVERTVAWYQNQVQGENAIALCQGDIKDFENDTK